MLFFLIWWFVFMVWAGFTWAAFTWWCSFAFVFQIIVTAWDYRDYQCNRIDWTSVSKTAQWIWRWRH